MGNFQGLLIKCAAYKFFRKKKLPATIKKILVVTYDAIGDMILTTPLLRELKLNLPNTAIDVLASTRNAEILQYNPYISKVFIQTRNKKNLRELKTLLAIRGEKYDVIIDLWSKVSLNLTLRIRLMNGRYYISPHKRDDFLSTYKLKSHDLKIYNSITGTNEIKHFSELFLDTLEAFSIAKPEKIRYDFFYDEKAQKKAFAFFSRFSSEIKIGFNFYGGHELRIIDIADAVKIANGIISQIPHCQVFLLFPPAALLQAFEIVNRVNSPRLQLCPAGTILETGAYIDCLDVIVTTDTSIVHIASALNKKLVAIFSGVEKNYTEFKPMCQNFSMVFSPHHKINSIEGFSVEQVIEKTTAFCGQQNAILEPGG